MLTLEITSGPLALKTSTNPYYKIRKLFPSGSSFCCVPGTALILKGALSLPFVLKLIKSQTQPDGGEGNSGMATGYPVTVLGEEAALPRQGTANA
jgi:hypothetical protein